MPVIFGAWASVVIATGPAAKTLLVPANRLVEATAPKLVVRIIRTFLVIPSIVALWVGNGCDDEDEY